ncbi:hypothetical protein H0E84_04865 [Luteimonas sp. SJ-92]|uniref:Uncharacterized protein n=1 Tax=Luteimonas salinisoli TaxID=2752307 RepID=A0A853J933_9GAMM|nr:hypothetical protein [Luteimonas salinisoli]NZA25706.1 hypothetical protein [Luteimonas salinisoli]
MQDTIASAPLYPSHPRETQAGISGEIERELERLGSSLPGMHARHPFDADFWVSFKARAREIECRARDEAELRHVQMRLVLMLSETAAGGATGPIAP